MRKLLLPLIGVALLFASSAAAPPEGWRDAYKDAFIAPSVIESLDQADVRLDALLDELVRECELTPCGAERIRAEIEWLKYDYVTQHFSGELEPTGARSNSNYDSQYREPARLSGELTPLSTPSAPAK